MKAVAGRRGVLLHKLHLTLHCSIVPMHEPLPPDTDLSSIFLFFHSLLRWAILFTVAVAGFTSLARWLRKVPVISWQRSMAITAMVLCHVQLVLGFVLYGMRYKSFGGLASDQARYWKVEHVAAMLLVIALVTIGRLSSKRARNERAKHLRVAVFYLLALALMLWMIPWPFTTMGEGRGWI